MNFRYTEYIILSHTILSVVVEGVVEYMYSSIYATYELHI